MSTVLYSFRAKSDDDLSAQVDVAKLMAKDLIYSRREGIEFQVFNTSVGTIYRVIESGYGLKNKMWKKPDIFPPCNYDDRTDVPETDIPNEAIADEIDELINSKQYSVITILKAEQVLALFETGVLVITPGALGAINSIGANPMTYVRRHESGDHGDLCEEDRLLNEEAIKRGLLRIMSSYKVGDKTIWVITEADRSATTTLLPEEY
jgi:hypothetical protein